MKALLIRPSNPTGSAYLTKFGFLPTPLGLLQLAGDLLTIPGTEVRLVDMEADRANATVEQLVDTAADYDPDLVGITIHATAAHTTSLRIASMIKERRPDTVLVAGGHHATFLPYEMIRGGFDIAVLGEGDDSIIEIGERVKEGRGFGDVAGVVYRNERGAPVRTKPRPLIRDLDRLPIPAYHLVDKHSYTFKVFGDRDTVACVETSRGCPYACDFCSVTPTWGNKWRNKSNRRIIEELDIVQQLGYDWIFFTDDIFVVYPNVAQRMRLFDLMIERGYNFKWIAQMRADVTAKNPTLIRRAAEAGLRVGFLGIESGSPEILRKMHKGLFTPLSVKAVRTLSENGVVVLLGMMLGAPYESFHDMLTTIRFAWKLADAGADAVQFSLYTPLPGTRIFDDALRNNKLFTLDWDRYDLLTPVMRTRVHPAIVQLLQMFGNHSFYIRKYLKGHLIDTNWKTTIKGYKRDLVLNAQKFMFDMMPTYIREFLGFPRHILKTTRLYHTLAKLYPTSKEKIQELLEFSSKIIYLEVGGKNPYFMIKEAE
ncbi:B12-binding domain-containing radical SAM protein [Candidatus Marsarchaeota G2 archaeon ECH_B_2]|uniref:B12-binding domain-containing radical SAM protein n=4 Tax=Candidatus Marsarchaeota group 2 TaxID=2203771 RepID=A0A2R6B4V3_9ARCH|nr:MAG: B12-binding domain-containing radical SAM protein [Candidatus Marsarchaeota G2 archaeon ECH_B_2]PSN98067.1 MAG: B12-binding domain-containing radical SAM protein [Candidatus Marsarchaeota G2 archaeon ECH_B_3]PSN99626.1 MAG: B12-binding domain-containing radical SAM protein [Candidatus Marsarchaeota G2 archaeon ECH_B_1]